MRKYGKLYLTPDKDLLLKFYLRCFLLQPKMWKGNLSAVLITVISFQRWKRNIILVITKEKRKGNFILCFVYWCSFVCARIVVLKHFSDTEFFSVRMSRKNMFPVGMGPRQEDKIGGFQTNPYIKLLKFEGVRTSINLTAPVCSKYLWNESNLKLVSCNSRELNYSLKECITKF